MGKGSATGVDVLPGQPQFRSAALGQQALEMTFSYARVYNLEAGRTTSMQPIPQPLQFF